MNNQELMTILGVVFGLFKLIDYYFKKQNEKTIQTHIEKEFEKLIKGHIEPMAKKIGEIEDVVYFNKATGTKTWDIHNKMDETGSPVWYADRVISKEIKQLCIDILTSLNAVVGKISPKQDQIAIHINDIKSKCDHLPEIKRVIDKLN